MKLLRVAKKFMFYDCFSFYSFTTPATATHPSQSSMPLHRIPNFVSLCDCDSKVKKKESIFIAPVKRRERKLFPIFMRPGFDFLCFQASAFYILIIFLFWNFLMDYKYRNIIFKGEMYNNKILLHNSTFFHFLLPLVFNLINFISYFFSNHKTSLSFSWKENGYSERIWGWWWMAEQRYNAAYWLAVVIITPIDNNSILIIIVRKVADATSSTWSSSSSQYVRQCESAN